MEPEVMPSLSSSLISSSVVTFPTGVIYQAKRKYSLIAVLNFCAQVCGRIESSHLSS